VCVCLSVRRDSAQLRFSLLDLREEERQRNTILKADFNLFERVRMLLVTLAPLFHFISTCTHSLSVCAGTFFVMDPSQYRALEPPDSPIQTPVIELTTVSRTYHLTSETYVILSLCLCTFQVCVCYCCWQ
jgi:hypothetical protein